MSTGGEDGVGTQTQPFILQPKKKSATSATISTAEPPKKKRRLAPVKISSNVPPAEPTASEPPKKSKVIVPNKPKPTKPQKPATPMSFIRKLKNAAERTNNEPTKIINFNDQLQKTLETKKKAKQRKLEKEKQKLLESQGDKKQALLVEQLNESLQDSSTLTGKDNPDTMGDDCEGEDDDFPVSKGTARLISNLERFYSNGFVDGYDFDDDWIDDSNFNTVTELVLQKTESISNSTKPEFDGFYVHQGDIKFTHQSPKAKKPPKKKRKLNPTTKASPVPT